MEYEDLDINLSLKTIMESTNLVDKIGKEEVATIGKIAQEGYVADKASRMAWEERQANANKLALQVKEAKTFPWPNACFSLDTDILTDNGWRPIGDVQVGDRVLSRGEDGVSAHYPVTQIFRHKADELVHFVGKSIDLLVTKNHKMVLQSKTGKQHFMEAGSMVDATVTNRYIPLTSHSNGISPPSVHGIPTRAYLRLLGWYVAEGHAQFSKGRTYFRKKVGGFVDYGLTTGSFGIAQSATANPEKCAIVRQDIDACGFSYRERESGFTLHARSMPQSLKDELRAMGRQPTRFLPRHVFSYAKQDLLEMLDTMILGDGCTNRRKGHQSYYTISKQLADDVQELCQYLGLRATIAVREPMRGGMIRGRPIDGVHQTYCVSINRKPLIQVAKLHRSVVPYNGEVACVEVEPHHTVYVRRNGRALWCGNSNVKFPLITVAAMQYAAKAYPALISGTDLVKCRVIGLDPTGEKSARALRLATHMSWQNLEQDTEWEPEHDKMLLVQAIAGCAFVKRLYEPGPARQCTRLVLPNNLVVNYFATSLDDAPRYTHTYYLSHNAIRERELDKRFAEVEDVEPTIQTESSMPVVVAKNERQGIQPPPADKVTPYFTAEQYCWWDFDGDGYQEPYIVTFDINTGQVRRIVARFLPSGVKRRGDQKTGDIYRIEPVRVFLKYGFVPSPDGGFYDLGLGSLLGPINDSINTALNQIIDAGTMKNLGGGFFGRGFKGKGGAITFQPGQWYPADAPGDDLRKNILPLPVPEPSAVLFQVVGLLMQYGERIVSATELQVGENIGQNTPAETARTMNENGARVYNAIYKRTWKDMKDEFRLQYELNKLFLEVDQDYTELTSGQGAMIRVTDYHDPNIDVVPAADPHIVSDTQRIDNAKLLVSMSQNTPGFNRYQTGLRLLKALNVPEIDQVYPPPMTQGPDGKPVPAQDYPPPQDPKMLAVQVKQGELQLEVQKYQSGLLTEKIRLQMELEKTMAQIQELRAKAELEIAQTKSEEVEPQIKLIYAQIESAGQKRDHLVRTLEVLSKLMPTTESGNPKPEAMSALPQAAVALASPPVPATVQ